MGGRTESSKATQVELADALTAIIKNKCWLRYDEGSTVKKAKVHVGLIREAHSVLEAAHNVDPSFSFKRTTVEEAIKEILKRKQKQFQVPDSQVGEYIETYTRRFMNVCHVVHHQLKKEPRPSWCNKLPWIAAGVDDAQETQPAAASGAKQGPWVYGFDDASHKAYRQRRDSKCPEFAA